MTAPVVDADRTRKALAGVAATAPLTEAAFCGACSSEATERVYDEVFRRAACVLESGRPVILDASFRTRALRARARDLAKRYGVPFFFLECRAAREACERRLRKRALGPCVSDGRREILQDFIDRWERVDELSPGEHFVVDTGQAREATRQNLSRRLPSWPPGLNG